MILPFAAARQKVLELAPRAQPGVEEAPLEQAYGRALASAILADRDYPPFPRATRDGFAVRAADLAVVPAELSVIGEVKAGSQFPGRVGAGECVSIMTGAPVPAGADAVVMVEDTRGAGPVTIQLRVSAGDNVVPRGSEVAAGAIALAAGCRLGYPEIALLASVGCRRVPVYRRPRVAILATGDEIVELDRLPEPFQIRNSNSYSLRAQVAAAGGEPCPLPIAPDEYPRLRELLERGLQADLLVISGGVSMGKFDLVENVLHDLGAEIFFDGVEIQPGRPLVFGRARGTLFFGLPGNPLSTMVCFELFARTALERLAGLADRPLPFLRARLAEPVRTKPGLTRFLPAQLGGDPGEPTVRLSGWQGSGDVAALVRSNCFLVVPPDRPEMAAGEWAGVLPRERW
jgi:molybdopterin molybdotransferase